MGELLGVVASGIAVAQLAGAIVGSTQKIYSFYSEMKDAPRKLHDLLVEIELLGEVLVDFYDQNSTPTTGQFNVLPKVVTHCKTVMQNLDEVLNVLENDLNRDGGRMKKQWRTVKVVLKEKTLKELTERLERAKSLLTLAVNCHSIQFNRAIQKTLIQLSNAGTNAGTAQISKVVDAPAYRSIQVSKREKSSLINEAAHSNAFFSYRSTTLVLHQQTKKKLSAGLSTDAIVTDEDIDIDIHSKILPRAWMRLNGTHIKQSRRFGRWTYSFRPLCVVPDNSPVFQACRNGDVGKIIDLVQARSASVFDISQNGFNLIHIAAAYLRADLCRWLLAQGVQATEIAYMRYTALHIATDFPNTKLGQINFPTMPEAKYVANSGRYNDTLESIRVLVEVGRCDPMQEAWFGQTPLHLCCGDAESFNYMLNQESFSVCLDPQDDIESVLEVHIERDSHNTDEIIKFMMEKSFEFSESRRLKNSFHHWWYALHHALKLLSDIVCDPKDMRTPIATSSLIVALLEMRVDVHQEKLFLGTPLMYFFNTHDRSPIYALMAIERMPLAILTWFKLLRRAGYNLQDYIIQESARHQLCVICPGGNFIRYMHIFRVRNSTDIVCNFEWYDCRNQERNFKLIESQQEGKMPGAWEDSDDESSLLHDYDLISSEFTPRDMQRPSRSPDVEMSFMIGSLIEGKQNFNHLESIRRRELNCYCSWFNKCPHEPQFGRYDIETGELDLCSCLNMCECKYEDANDDGSKVESEAESIDNSNEDEKEQKEEGVLEDKSEFACGTEYYCLHCDRKYPGLTSAN